MNTKIMLFVMGMQICSLQAMETNSMFAKAADFVLGCKGAFPRKAAAKKGKLATPLLDSVDELLAYKAADKTSEEAKSAPDDRRDPSCAVVLDAVEASSVQVAVVEELEAVRAKQAARIQWLQRKNEQNMAFFGSLLIGQASLGVRKTDALAQAARMEEALSGKYTEDQRLALHAMKAAYQNFSGLQIAEKQVAWYQLREKIHGDEGFEPEETGMY